MKSTSLDKEVIYLIAEIAYGSVKTWVEKTGGAKLASWEKAPQALRATYVEGVFFVVARNSQGVFTTPRDLLAQWSQFKTVYGWGVSDPETIIDPLSIEEDLKIKGALFLNIVNTFLF